MSQYPLRLPDSLMAAARKAAKDDNTSMNQLFVSAIAEKLSALQTEDLLAERAKQADIEAFNRVLDQVPDVPPGLEEDRITP
ncbi:MAG: hypothetical protein HQL50_04025 [Magnetococcales bacterium]|nr:hypothetical protein [Magnetococcales bacterium]